jgi:hypothetical protein
MIRNVEDQSWFFYIILHEKKLRNKLTNHLDLIMHMFVPKKFIL